MAAMSEAADWIKNKLNGQMEQCKPFLDAIEKSLWESRFVLSGYFHFSDPIFTKHGDLLVNLKYLPQVSISGNTGAQSMVTIGRLSKDQKPMDMPTQLGTVPGSNRSLNHTG